MAVLDNTARSDVVARFIREHFVGLGRTADLTNAEVRTLINDLDAWLDSQLTEANNAITVAVRTKASGDTKFAALAWVAMKRAGII